MTEERILTQHPQGKKGVNITRAKYDAVRGAMIEALREHGPMPFRELTARVEDAIGDGFNGSVGWYTESVKLDLEARHAIQRMPDTKPQKLRLLA